MSRRRVVYTCLFGGYETLLDQPVAGDTDVEFVAITDDPTVSSASWQVRLVAAPFSADQNRSSRRPKILAHEYLPEFDESLYIDNTVLLTAPPDQLFDALLPTDVPMALLSHSFRTRVREEFSAVVVDGRDVEIICAEQLAHYERVAPEVLDSRLLWGGMLLRRHHDPALRATMQTWWEHVLRYSRRDQLSLPFALRCSGLRFRVHDLDNHLSDYHSWPRVGVERDPAGGAPADIAADMRADAAASRADATAARAEIVVQRDRAERAEDLAAQVSAELTEAQRQLEASRAKVVSLYESNSWRVTRPLRALSTWGRRVRVARRSVGPTPR